MSCCCRCSAAEGPNLRPGNTVHQIFRNELLAARVLDMSKTRRVPVNHAGSPPLQRAAVMPLVEPHLDRLGRVLVDAWDDYAASRDAPASTLGRIQAASQGMVISDLTAAPARTHFQDVDGVDIVTRYDRPWVHLAGGQVQIRFMSLTPSLGVCPGHSQRSVRLAYHLPDDTLDVEVPLDATILTAGFVLDARRERIERLALVCLVGFNTVHYWFPLPGADAKAAATQLPLTELSDPIIRSARAAAAHRLAARGDAQ